jgi:ATP-binding cassette, subfamily B, bacterial
MKTSFPFYPQTEAMDCGPTCLRMVAKHYGKAHSLSTLKEKMHLSREGVSFLSISEVAEEIGFRTLAVSVPFEKLATKGSFPCIVHWNQNHFAVAYAVKSKYVKGEKSFEVSVADPAAGLLTYTQAEFCQSWLATKKDGDTRGLVLFLEPTAQFYEESKEDLDEGKEKKEKLSPLAFIAKYLTPYKAFVFQLFLGLLFGSLLQLVFPLLTQSIVDVGIQTHNLPFIYMVLLAQVVLFASRTTVDFIRRWILLHVSTRINIALISDFLIKLMKLPLSFFSSRMTGDLMQRIDDHRRIQNFISTSTLSVLFSFFNLFIFGAVLVFYHLPIFVVFAVGSALYIAWILLFMQRRKQLDYKRFQQMAGKQSNLIQLINGMPEIKLNNCETQKRWEWERIQAKLFKINIKATELEQYQQAGSLCINEAKNLLITFLSAQAVINADMTLGMMLSVQYIIGQLNAPIMDMVQFLYDFQDAQISLARLDEIHQQKNEDVEIAPIPQPLSVCTAPPAGKGEYKALSAGEGWVRSSEEQQVRQNIHIKNLTFHYEGVNSPKVLDKVSCQIPEGKITAIVGGSGSGKTTLLKLLLKFYPPTNGEITLGAIPLSVGEEGVGLPSKAWRKRCGVVMQDGFIFSDTIAKNIALSDETPDKKRLLYAAKVANIQEFVENLPLGYNTKIGAEGVGLSGGQKQRILIARAVYKDPEFLFFDEATSALDANNEKIIMENLQAFFKGRTVVVIAHRLSTVKNADQIIVLEKGKIVEMGNHLLLSKEKGRYYELVKNQLELGN